MKSTILFGLLICLGFSFFACSKDEDSEPVLSDVTLTYDVSHTQANGYTATIQKIDSVAICKAFGGISYAQFKTLLASTDTTSQIKYTAVKPDGTTETGAPTANGNGHWFAADGTIISWGASAIVYSEYQDVNFAFNIGCHPDNTGTLIGNTYTIKQGFIYRKGTKKVRATCVFNITLN